MSTVDIQGREISVKAINTYLRLTEAQRRAMLTLSTASPLRVGMGRNIGQATARALERKGLVALTETCLSNELSMAATPLGDEVRWYAEHGKM
jgi:hypothetical protein